MAGGVDRDVGLPQAARDATHVHKMDSIQEGAIPSLLFYLGDLCCEYMHLKMDLTS
jgi:hypothetical protein